jgi:integrase
LTAAQACSPPALPIAYPEVPVQRCWAHKIRNVLSKVCKPDQQGIKSDLHRIMNATTLPAAWNAGKQHTVPLSDQAVALLSALPRPSDLVFPGARAGRPLGSTAMKMILRRMGRGEATVHGFRSSFRDWAAEQTGHPNHVVEMALAHTIGNGVEATYRRGDLLAKRRQLMQDWATYCG